ncbi:MAG TPA: hypothetical protein VIU62_08600, partial [Chloroflexota bacterium]
TDWKDLQLTVVASDDSRSIRGFEQALELARQGNELSRPLLDRIVKRDPDSSQASAAREALRALDTRMSGRLVTTTSQPVSRMTQEELLRLIDEARDVTR